MKQTNPKIVVTGRKTRFSYLNANEPKEALNGGKPRYSASLIIPKSDAVTIEKIKKAIQAAYEDGQGKFRGNGKAVPALKDIKYPLRDGDQERPDDEAYRNSYFVNCNSERKPKAFDVNGNDIIDPSELYSGIYGKAMIEFFAYNTNGNRGIGCGFQGLKKYEDGAPLGGSYVAADLFADDDDSDDDLLK